MSKPRIIVLNGTSSAGKTTLSKVLQSMLPEPYLHVGIDTFIDIMPEHINEFKRTNVPTIGFWCKESRAPSGQIIAPIVMGSYAKKINKTYRTLTLNLLEEGYNIVLEDVFLDGKQNFHEWSSLLANFHTIYVGIKPPLEATILREQQRGDRRIGTALAQHYIVHNDIIYDLEIDNHAYSNEECAQMIFDHFYGTYRPSIDGYSPVR